MWKTTFGDFMKNKNIELLSKVALRLDELGFHNFSDDIDAILLSELDDSKINDAMDDSDKELKDLIHQEEEKDLDLLNELFSEESSEKTFADAVNDLDIDFSKAKEECLDLSNEMYGEPFLHLSLQEKDLFCAEVFARTWFPAAYDDEVDDLVEEGKELGLSVEEMESILSEIYLKNI